MRIPVIYHDNTEDCVPDMLLERLLSSNRIKLFYRFSEGWVKVGAGALRGRGGYYNGPDRRSVKVRAKTGPKFGGHRRSGECSAVTIFDAEGRFGGCRGISRDISERKKSEEDYLTIKKLESVGVLAGGIAHDFNNLLQVILGNISLAKELTTSDDRIISLLEQAEIASRQASDVTKRLITFSQGGAPVKETVSIAGVIEDAALFTLSGSNVKCEFKIAGDLWPVEADEGQMRQVINNIVRNGQEAMRESGILSIRVENVEADTELDLSLAAGRYIRISIKDNGIGIPEENLCKVFDPYFTTKEMGARKGEGLGLAVCHSIIKNHKGAIHVESQAGVGSTFFIYLPASPRHRRLRGRASGKMPVKRGKG